MCETRWKNKYAPAAAPPSGGHGRPLEVEGISVLVRRGASGGRRGRMSTVGNWSFGERDNCGGRLDGGVKVGRGGVFGIVVRIVKWWYRRLGHKWEGGWRGTGGARKERRKKKKGWQSESEAWGKIKRETCNFDLFYDLWTGPSGEINTDEAELKGILHLLICW